MSTSPTRLHSHSFIHNVGPGGRAGIPLVGALLQHSGMSKPVIGIEALSDGVLTRGSLRWNYSRLHPGIYLPKDTEQTLLTRTYAAWLWTGRQAVIAGRAAAALHGAKWVDADTPIELIAKHGRRQSGITVRQERHSGDELVSIAGMPVTSAARTALNLARHLPRNAAVAHLDALSAATGLTFGCTIAQRKLGPDGST